MNVTLTANVVNFTPEIALKYLERNTHNRGIHWGNVEILLREMSEGRWQLNGEAIKIAEDGTIHDGQHRLLAVSQLPHSLGPIPIMVISGLSSESQTTMDQGSRRTAGQQLSLAGTPADETLAAAIRTYIWWSEGKHFGDQGLIRKASSPEVVEWAQFYPESVTILRELSAMGCKRIKSRPSITLAIGLRLHEVDPDDAIQFLSSLIGGDALSASSPILALRERLGRIKEDKLRVTDRDLIGFFLIAWNAWRAGRSLTKIQRPKSGWTISNFPEPK